MTVREDHDLQSFWLSAANSRNQKKDTDGESGMEKSNKQHIRLSLFSRELHYARACPISLQHKLHIIVFALNHGAEKLASYLSP